MMHLLLALPCTLLCAIGYRLRGGLWNDRLPLPGQMARLLWWGVPCGLTALAAGAPWWLAVLIVPLMWATSTIPLFGFIDMGRNDGTPTGDFMLGTLRGLLAVLPVVIALWCVGYTHWWYLALAGTSMGLLYDFAWFCPIRVAGFGLGDGPPNYDPPETGEVYYGAVVGLGLFLAVWGGV